MKKIIVLASIVVSALASQASYLWWQIDANPQKIAEGETWATANLYARNTSTGEKGTAIATAKNLKGEGSAVKNAVIDTSVLSSGYGFYVELLNSSNQLVGYTVNYSSLTVASLSSYITEQDIEPVPAAIWHGGTFNAPEPTSAMLMLIGVAGLALRRKQRKA